jgi:hypothetical protein
MLVQEVQEDKMEMSKPMPYKVIHPFTNQQALTTPILPVHQIFSHTL